jgi:RIO kinase 1
MSSDRNKNTADGPFEDVPENANHATPADLRQSGHFIDDETGLQWTEESTGEEDEDDIDEEYDDNRIEDEDWEVAEGGLSVTPQHYSNLD